MASTDSMSSESASRRPGDWTIILALDCQALTAGPQVFQLRDLDEIDIARGPERAFQEAGTHARLALTDGWVSEQHARLTRAGNRWTIEDRGSTNGTRVNGERVARAELSDGDVIECGGTFLVWRRTDGPAPRPEALADVPPALRTLSPTLGAEFDRLSRLACSPIPLLILGESGTGKEGTVNAVHALSGREGPLVAVNCGAIPAAIVESELFGSRRGAFSGAEDRTGLVRAAEAGTLFLDEIADLPASSQAALLRVIQEKEILALGTTRAVPVDVRIVAATNLPVAQMLDERRLRPDLYARLRGYEVRLLPLKERLEDLGLLIATLIARHDRSKRRRTLSRAAASVLFNYPWPLNIRELEQYLSAALTLASGEIRLEHLPTSIRGEGRSRRAAAASLERSRLLQLVERHGGNVSAAAHEIGTSRSQLYRLLERHEVRAEDAREERRRREKP